MIWHETFLMAVLLLTTGISAYTDLKFGKIKNILLLAALLLAVPVQIVNCFQGSVDTGTFLLNMLIAFVLLLTLYVGGGLAAGDCKLLMVIAVIYPHSLYWDIRFLWAKSLSLVLFAVAVAYIYVVIDTIVNIFTHTDMFLLTWKKTVTKHALIEFSKKWCVVVSLTTFLHYLNDKYIHLTSVCIMLIIFLALGCANGWIERLKTGWWIALVLNVVYWILTQADIFNVAYSVALAAIFFGFSRAIQIFNYKIISIDKLKEGMIVSALTIENMCGQQPLTFANSKDKENIASRLTKENVDELRRTGIDVVRIVRKIPFAVIVFVACALYLMLERYYAI